jgi:hypothetical protein
MYLIGDSRLFNMTQQFMAIANIKKTSPFIIFCLKSDYLLFLVIVDI